MSGPAGSQAVSGRLTARTVGSGLVVTLGFGLVGGDTGLLAAGALVAAWYLSSVPVTVAIGHVLLGALLSGEPGAIGIGIAELGLLGLLSTAGPLDTLRDGAVLLGFTALLGGVAAAGWEAGGVTAAAGALAGTAVLVGYGLHRYELLRLGLIESDEEPNAPTRPDSADAANDDVHL